MTTDTHTFQQARLRLLIISDTHGVLDVRIAELIQDADIAIHAGDVMDAAVLVEMKPLIKTIAVAGNNDAQGLWCSQRQRHIAVLPNIAYLQLPSGTIAVEHGHRFGNHQPDHSLLREAHPEVKLIVYGHTHKQVIEQRPQPWVVNPGAAGRVRNQGGPRCLSLEINRQRWTFERHIFPTS